MFKTLKGVSAIILAFGLLITQVGTVFACGGLVAPNGAIRLSRATTLVAWHDGIEHYMTSFTYQGDVSNLGWIVPLPAVPLKIEEGGAWTLQRLSLETHPQPKFEALGAAAPTSNTAQVLQQVQVEALNITVIRGNGQEILNWATDNGFSLNDDLRSHLLSYAKGSPIFMAAKYDVARAKERRQIQGDGAPVLITMKTEHPWVPLEILALDGQQVHADLYMLTDQAINTSDVGAKVGQSAVGTDIPGARGFTVSYQEKMTPELFHDLSTDRNMSWVRQDSWLTYLSLDAPDTAVTYDLGVSSSGVIHLAPFGTAPMAVVDGVKSHDLPSWLPALPMGTPQIVLPILLLLLVGGGIFFALRARIHAKSKNSLEKSL